MSAVITVTITGGVNENQNALGLMLLSGTGKKITEQIVTTLTKKDRKKNPVHAAIRAINADVSYNVDIAQSNFEREEGYFTYTGVFSISLRGGRNNMAQALVPELEENVSQIEETLSSTIKVLKNTETFGDVKFVVEVQPGMGRGAAAAGGGGGLVAAGGEGNNYFNDPAAAARRNAAAEAAAVNVAAEAAGAAAEAAAWQRLIEGGNVVNAPPEAVVVYPQGGRVERVLPANAVNAISGNAIVSGTHMVNFHNEGNERRYYTENTFNSFVPYPGGRNAANTGYKRNPFTRRRIEPGNITRYVARIENGVAAAGGGGAQGGGRRYRRRTTRRRRTTKRRA